MQMVVAADNIKNVLEKSMTKWKVQLMVGDEVLGNVNIKTWNIPRRQPFTTPICYLSHTNVTDFKKVESWIQFGKELAKIKSSPLVYDDLKLFGESE